MSSIRARRAAVAGVLSLALVACSDDAPEPGPSPDTSDTAGSHIQVPEDLAEAFSTTLDERAKALRERDKQAFVEGLDQSDPGFLVAQRGYFDNLAQLPMAEISYELDRTSLLRQGDQYWVVVEITTQLEGFDPEPVMSRDRFRFTPDQDGEGYDVSSVTDPDWERSNQSGAQPWDMVPVLVESRPGVLGIFDEQSIGAAGPLLDSIERGIAEVSAAVPYDWPRSVVVYATSGTEFLRSLDDLPGGDPENLDGVAFPVMAGADSDRVVATRIALHPSMLGRPGLERDRLIRHELTHVALGRRDDRAPSWLSEGIAEWVSVQPLGPELRRLPEEALGAAEAGVEGLPRDKTFNDAGSGAHYGLSWWACEYLVASFGRESLWRLLDELDRSVADQNATLRALVGLNTRQLARRGAKLMIEEYDPEFLASSTEEPTPTTEPPTPTDTPTNTVSP